MGGSLSSQSNKEGVVYKSMLDQLSKPRRASIATSTASTALPSSTVNASVATTASVNTTASAVNVNDVALKAIFNITSRAKILKYLSHELLWDNFLDNETASFAISISEISSLMMNSLRIPASDDTDICKPPTDKNILKEDIEAYFELVSELDKNETASSANIDFMVLLSSVLLLDSDTRLETKIDKLYSFIHLTDVDGDGFTIDEFHLALVSFDHGLSIAMGRSKLSEAALKQTALYWFNLIADPASKEASSAHSTHNIRISHKQFFDFATNRQHSFRRLLEIFEVSSVSKASTVDCEEYITNNEFKPPSGGDQFLANPAWKKTAERMVPAGIVPNLAKPNSLLSLEWVHGYRGFDCRNNVRYLLNDEVVFTAAALTIVQYKDKQYFFGEHTDDIISIAVHNPEKGNSNINNSIIATGQIGKTPAIHLYYWKTLEDDGTAVAVKSFESLASMRGFHTKGVCQLAFSVDSKRLFSIGIEYSIAVYNSDVSHRDSKEFGKMIASAQGPKSSIFHVSNYFTGSHNHYGFVSCGEKHVRLWSLSDKVLKCEAEKLDKKTSYMCCSGFHKDAAIVGSSSGELLVISKESKVLVSLNKINNRPGKELLCDGTSEGDGINALWYIPRGKLSQDFAVSNAACTTSKNALDTKEGMLIVGNRKGNIMLLQIDGDLNINYLCNYINTSEYNSPIRSICASCTSPDRQILVGTQKCEILEFNLTTQPSSTRPSPNPNPLVVGHFKGELWGLAIRPHSKSDSSTRREFCTVGGDGYLRVWDVASHSEVRHIDMKGYASCCTYSPDGQFIAVGFGTSLGGKNQGKENGNVRIYYSDHFESESPFEIKESKQAINVVKFSPDGTTLSVGSRDNSIYHYSVAQKFKRKSKFSKHSAGITHFDYSSDSKVIQSCCSAYEILFSDPHTGAQITNGATTLINVQWDSWTCCIGWPTIAIWSGSLCGSDVNAVDRSPVGNLLAVADDFGKVKVFRYPSCTPGADACVYNGHSSHVTNVRWIPAYHTDKKGRCYDDYLISIGGDDKCIFQWKHSSDDKDNTILRSARGHDSSVDTLLEDDGVAFDDVKLLLDGSGPDGGDQFCAVKPWLGAIVPPRAFTNPEPQKKSSFYTNLNDFSSAFIKLKEHNDIDFYDNSGTVRGEGSLSAIYGEVEESSSKLLSSVFDSCINDSSHPDCDEFELDWIHGYRGYDCRNNVRYINQMQKDMDGKDFMMTYVVYYAAALGVVLSKHHSKDGRVTYKQSYFEGHTDDIMSMAILTSAAVVATGQMGIGKIYVWDVPSMKTVAVINSKQRTCKLLEFSKDGRLLIALSEEKLDKTIAVIDWRNEVVIVTSKCDAANSYHLTSDNISNQTRFVSCGDKFIKVWTLHGRNLTASKVSIGLSKEFSIQAFNCVAEINNTFYVGCDDGSVYYICDGKTVGGKVLHQSSPLATAASANASATGSVKKTSDGKALKKCGGKAASIQSMYAYESKKWLITGAADGTVCIWSVKSIDSNGKLAKPELISSLTINGMSTGCDRGACLTDSCIIAKQIQSLCCIEAASNSHSKVPFKSDTVLLLVSTRGCDVLQFYLTSEGTFVASEDGQKEVLCDVLVRGHCNGELWGLATHPKKPEYCTVGDDKTLRFFKCREHVMLACIPLGNIARSCCYHPFLEIVAVGFGGRLGNGKEGGGGLIRLYNSDYTTFDSTDAKKLIIAERCDAKNWISDTKFSSDGKTLVVGAHDCKIYIYDLKYNDQNPMSTIRFLLRTTFAKHNSVINHIDLSQDSRFMQSTCSAYELLFSDTTTGKQITSASELKDVKWDTWTCTLGWPVQGIWAKDMDGSDINATARSRSGHVIATADDFGKVKVFRYPCVGPDAQSLSYSGHASHVTNLRWSYADEYLISTGGNDKCVFQWKHTMHDCDSNVAIAAPKKDSATHDQLSAIDEAEIDSEESLMFANAPAGGDQAGCVKPWLGAVRTPTNPPPVNPSEPAANLLLKWVHGYSSGMSVAASNARISSNLYYNASWDIVYPAAALGVKLHRPSTHNNTEFKQDFFRGHDNDILCLCISNDRQFVATGQIASHDPSGKIMVRICVWDAVECREQCRMENCHQRGVISLSFSHDGHQLLSVGQDDKNTHICWVDVGGNWSRTKVAATSKADQNIVSFTKWLHPASSHVQTNEYHFISGGNTSIHFWTLKGATMSMKQGRFGRKYAQVPILCVANLQSKDESQEWKVVAGTAAGSLYVFDDREVGNSVEAHEGPIYCLAEVDECKFLVSGGKDKTFKIWNQNLQPVSQFVIPASFYCVDGSICSLDIKDVPYKDEAIASSNANAAAVSRDDKDGSGSTGNNSSVTVLVGTAGGDIIEVTTDSSMHVENASKVDKNKATRRTMDFTGATVARLVSSHSKGELWGLAPNPIIRDIVATAGDDGTLRIWSMSDNRMMLCHDLGRPARSIAWSRHVNTNGDSDDDSSDCTDWLLAVGFFQLQHKRSKTGKKSVGKKGSNATSADISSSSSSSSNGNSDSSCDVHVYHLRFDSTMEGITLTKVAVCCKSGAWISQLKFVNPEQLDGSKTAPVLAVCSHDKKVYFYRIDVTAISVSEDDTAIETKDLTSAAKLISVFDKHSTAVLHIDFSRDGNYFQTNCQAGELLYGELTDKTSKQETSATKFADYHNINNENNENSWQTQTCKFGWSVQGIWPPGAGNDDINAVDRDIYQKYLATADDFGNIKLFRYPCVKDGSKYQSFQGHSSHVTNIRFTMDGKLTSTGGYDKCLFVWEIEEH